MTDRVLERLPDLRLAADDDVLPLRPANFVSRSGVDADGFHPERAAG